MKRKFADSARVKGNDVKASFRGRTGTVVGYVRGSGYNVKFDDGLEEFVYAHWLEAA
jgi:ribosomal protein L21E